MIFEFNFEKGLPLIICASHPSVVTKKDRKVKATSGTTGSGKKREAKDPEHCLGL